MAKCTKTDKVVKVIQEEKFTLELTRKEADFLYSLVGKCAGPLKESGEIYRALRIAGAESYRLYMGDRRVNEFFEGQEDYLNWYYIQELRSE